MKVVEKTPLLGPQDMFTQLVNTYVIRLKREIDHNPKRSTALQITEENISDRIVQSIKIQMEAEGYLVEGPAPNLICRMILVVREPEPDSREVAIEAFRSYVWEEIQWSFVNDRVEFPHKIKIYRSKPEDIRVVLRELRKLGWKVSYRTGADHITIDCPAAISVR